MKKHIIYIFLALCISTTTYAQWSTSLNPYTGTGLFLGTNDPYPLRIYTDNVNRMHINHNTAYAVNSQPSIARNGYVGIGRTLTPTFIWNNPGPISLLHLNGDEGSVMGTQGYRNWMRNGITITNNSDMMFMGPRRRSADDVTDAVIGWADNPAGPGVGPDNMLFVFSTGTGAGTDLDGGGADGREIMRMNANGNIGMGPRFSNAAQPQGQLHINTENTLPAWLQVTNQSNTGQTATDGLRMGISNTNAYIYNQENAHLIFSTNATTANLSRERMRLTHIGAPGTPATAATGSTRVAISLDPAAPLTEPRSLVHIGENTGGIIPGADGTRNWMNVGYLATLNSDNIYVGLKNEGADRQDAVVAWGDNQTDLVNGSGPDNLRFIFANSEFAGSPGTAEAKSTNGQEIARFTPACAGCPVNTGSLGIGNFSPGSPNGPASGTNYVNATLDVNGDARIRTVTQDNALTQVLVRDPSDLGRIHWRDAATLTGGGGAGLGNDCGATPVPLAANREVPLGNNDFFFSGQSIPANGNAVGIGLDCTSPVNGKFNVLQNIGAPVNVSTTASHTSNQDVASVIGLTFTGLYSEATGIQTLPRINNIGGSFYASGASNNYAIRGEVSIPAGTLISQNNYSAYLRCSGPGNNRGIDVGSYEGQTNVGINATAATYSGTGSLINTGGVFTALGAENLNRGVVATADYPTSTTNPNKSSFGIYAAVGTGMLSPASTAMAVYGAALGTIPAGTTAFAGYFDGDVYVNGPTSGTGYVSVSDAQFKENVEPIRHVAGIIEQLQPKSYDFIDGNEIGMNFPTEHQFGFIAQEVEQVLPELVSNQTKPAMVDSAGNVIKPKVEYKGLNYIGFIALLMQDAKEKNAKIEEMANRMQQQDEINNQLLQKLDELAGRIEGCCNAPKSMTVQEQEPTGAVIRTKLEDNDGPTLGQNIPNPFETATRIPAYVPQDTRKAEIMFYGNDGKVLQTLPINDRGNVSVDVDAATLAAGVYSYTLFVDGKPVDTKRMVKR